MTAAATLAYRKPPQPGGMGRGALMALVVHAGLLAALAFGVSWRSSEPAGTTAELWAAVPQVAAPAAVAPPPPPVQKVEPQPQPKPEPPPPPPKAETRDADIALEKAKAAEKERQDRLEKERADKLAREKQEREKAEREKVEKERLAKAEREKQDKAEREAVARAEAARQKQLERLLGQAGATGAPQSTGTAQRDAGPSASYAGKIVARVRPNIVLTDTVPPTLRAEVELRVAPDGTITSRRLVKPSGNAAWDDAVIRAIDRTETLPKDENGRVPSSMIIAFTPV